MRVFVAGASGTIGRRLVPSLVEAGHDVTGMTRSADKADLLRGAGADPTVCDALDAGAVCCSGGGHYSGGAACDRDPDAAG